MSYAGTYRICIPPHPQKRRLNQAQCLPLKTKHSGVESPPPRLYRVQSSAITALTFYCNSLLCRESIHCTLRSGRVRLSILLIVMSRTIHCYVSEMAHNEYSKIY